MNFDLTWGDGSPVNHADHRAVGLATLDTVRDSANRWVFPEAGEPWSGVTGSYITGGQSAATHFVDVSGTIDLGVASLAEHRAYIEGLNREFDPSTFLKTMLCVTRPNRPLTQTHSGNRSGSNDPASSRIETTMFSPSP